MSGSKLKLKPNKHIKRLDVATQWQLMWWKFKKHKVAILGMSVLAVFLFIAIFAEFLSPYTPHQRNTIYTSGSPMKLRFIDADKNFHIRPFVYGRISKRDPVTLRLLPEIDANQCWSLCFFGKGESYKLWGIFECDIHLFGVDEGFISLFGTDQLGRDLFSRCLYATRTSLSIGVIGVIITFFIGIIMGGIAGYIGGMADNIITRIMEFIRSIPTIPLWLSLAAALPREWTSLKVYFAITLILALVNWTNLARRVRGKLLTLREEDFIIAARLAGCRTSRVIFRHLLPSFLSYIIVDITISFPWMILGETSMSFLGLGLREPSVSWGVLLYSAQNIQTIAHMPWLLISGIFVIVSVIAFNFVGDGLRDAADPYSK